MADERVDVANGRVSGLPRPVVVEKQAVYCAVNRWRINYHSSYLGLSIRDHVLGYRQCFKRDNEYTMV